MKLRRGGSSMFWFDSLDEHELFISRIKACKRLNVEQQKPTQVNGGQCEKIHPQWAQ